MDGTARRDLRRHSRRDAEDILPQPPGERCEFLARAHGNRKDPFGLAEPQHQRALAPALVDEQPAHRIEAVATHDPCPAAAVAADLAQLAAPQIDLELALRP